ncbi:ImmA/IrrE family metallo-endopeptidase [Blautia hydrogenotrophica]|uniref:ImmA/IrrE family metallo-endopeptidase n=1 Tax=Blautia hydrogenotrophica TaxID=53443 RepID=UPI003AB54DE8
MNYEALLDEAHQEGLVVKEKPLRYNNGRIKGKRIAIRKDIETNTEKTCVLAEELGHYYTTTGDILDQSDTMNRKQEYRARLWGYNRLIGLMGIINAYIHGCQTLYEMAAYLDVTEEYLREAIFCYRNKYGVYKKIDNYVVYFEPCFKVCEILD